MTMQTPLSPDTDQPAPGPATAATRVHHRVGSVRRTERMYYAFIIPTLVLFTAFVVAPACVGIFYSFTDYLGFGQWKFLGLENYRALVSDPSILGSYGFTLGFAVVTVIVTQAIALSLAIALTKRVKFAAGLRSVFVIPMVVSGIIVAYVFNYLFSNTLPALATSVGFAPLEQSILGDPNLAWVSIVLVSAWQTVPGALLVYTAGLTSIPTDLYEASALDGAGAWKQLRSITLPLISGFIVINTVLGVKGYLGAYDVIVGLTGGGPGTATSSVAMTIFSGFTGGDYAYQMANATVFFIITVLISVLQLAATRGRNLRLA
ncbi:sugar ABC transporter permease [Curtobacterium sp. VKM Ac-2865]|uniref:carbohydrate ABC transporter permease n=1 Tax=Curtobacterium sp. VKM Ac-2865 TaxID=2783817 RepID=UPI00188A81B5|nr:sugar ABC transporter permease [Curtobacterium sp. VKM Ac-2865]MBF4583666.1 sugar ABC transporter permease [Curtobacterium sp. VKM Ac-2865]